jgi:hypothetical protein
MRFQVLSPLDPAQSTFQLSSSIVDFWELSVFVLLAGIRELLFHAVNVFPKIVGWRPELPSCYNMLIAGLEKPFFENVWNNRFLPRQPMERWLEQVKV